MQMVVRRQFTSICENKWDDKVRDGSDWIQLRVNKFYIKTTIRTLQGERKVDKRKVTFIRAKETNLAITRK